MSDAIEVKFAYLRRTNGHMEPMHGNAVQLFNSEADARKSAEDALPKLATGQRLVIIAVIGEYRARSGFEYIEIANE